MTPPQSTMTLKAWMELYGTPGSPSPLETGWKGFSHPTKAQWRELWRKVRAQRRPKEERK